MKDLWKTLLEVALDVLIMAVFATVVAVVMKEM